MTLEERASKVLFEAEKAGTYQGIMNCVAAHLYSYRAQAQQNEIDVYWSNRRDEISYWDNNGYEAIRNFFVVTNGENMRKRKLELIHRFHPEVAVCKENEGMGDMVAKGATTPYVVIAEDGQSAKGLWMTPGNCTEVGLDCRPKAAHMHEKLGIVAVMPPWGVPLSGKPIPTTSAFSIADMMLRSFLSRMPNVHICFSNFPWFTLSKNPLMSISTT